MAKELSKVHLALTRQLPSFFSSRSQPELEYLAPMQVARDSKQVRYVLISEPQPTSLATFTLASPVATQVCWAVVAQPSQVQRAPQIEVPKLLLQPAASAGTAAASSQQSGAARRRLERERSGVNRTMNLLVQANGPRRRA